MKANHRILDFHFFCLGVLFFLGIFLQGCEFSGVDLEKESSVPSPLPREDFKKIEFKGEKLDLGSWKKFVTKKKNKAATSKVKFGQSLGDKTIYFEIPSGTSFHRQIDRLKRRLIHQKYEWTHEIWKRSQTPQHVVIQFQKEDENLRLDIRQKITGRIVLVIDDVGHNRKWLALLQEIQRPMTLAVLPYMPYSKQMAGLQGKYFEIILHLPMENQSGLDPGPGAVLTEMTDEEIRQKVDEAVNSVPGAVGVNNHMGSKATADARVMGLVLEELHQRGLIFLDSLTGASSGAQVALEKGWMIRSRDVFLDDESDLEYIENQLVKVKKIAARRGEAIAIGHFKENTLLAIRNVVPKFEDEGFQFVFLSAFYASGEAATLEVEFGQSLRDKEDQG